MIRRSLVLSLVATGALVAALPAAAQARVNHRHVVVGIGGPGVSGAAIANTASSLPNATSNQFTCGVFVGYATANNPRLAFTNTGTETSVVQLNALGLPVGLLVSDTCNGTLPVGSTLPSSTQSLNVSNCYTFSVGNGGLLSVLIPSAGTITVRADGTYTGTCNVTVGLL